MRAHIRVLGRVQGVWFRVSTRNEAQRRFLTGWVRNMEDGSVEIVAQGPVEMLEELVAWCHRGPPSAQVDEVEVQYTGDELESLDDFQIRR